MEAKFTEAYEEHIDALFRYALFKVTDRELAKDLVQEVLVSAWGYVALHKEVDSFKSLFFRILHNRIIDYYRKKKFSSLDAVLEQGFDFGNDTREQLIDQLDGKHAMNYISSLPQQYRDVVFMRYVEDLTITEIAKITGDSNNTVTVRIHRGLQKLRELVEGGAI